MKWNKIKRSICRWFLLIFAIAFCMPHSVFAQDTILTTVVPSQFQLKIEMDGKGEVQIGERRFSKTTTIWADRHTPIAVSVFPARGYQVKEVLYNGKTLLEDPQSSSFLLPALTGDAVLTVSFKEDLLPGQTGENRHKIFLLGMFLVFSGVALPWLKSKEKAFLPRDR